MGIDIRRWESRFNRLIAEPVQSMNVGVEDSYHGFFTYGIYAVEHESSNLETTPGIYDYHAVIPDNNSWIRHWMFDVCLRTSLMVRAHNYVYSLGNLLKAARRIIRRGE